MMLGDDQPSKYLGGLIDESQSSEERPDPTHQGKIH
jgi:hypothetical protein